MTTIPLDEVVRKTLHKHRLPLHYYLPFLVIMRDGLKEMQYTVLPAENTVELTLDAKKEVTLPNDFVEEIQLYKSDGDRLSPLPRDYTISSFDSGVNGFGDAQLVSVQDSTVPIYVSSLDENYGKQFGMVQPRVDGYRVIRELNVIRLSNDTELSKVYLKYVTLPKKTTNKTLIHPYIESAVVAYLNWQVAMYTKQRDVMMLRNEYYNERRLAKAKLTNIGIKDILTSFRMYHNQAIKT
jgi:hypothetical protein